MHDLSIDDIKSIGNYRKRGIEIRSWFDKALLLETDDCILWPFYINRDGYGISSFGRERSRLVHVETFIRKYGDIIDGNVVCHGPCHQPSCFNYRHLISQTYSKNMIDRNRDGTSASSKKFGNMKLSDKDVITIKTVYKIGFHSKTRIAEIYGVSLSLISLILLGKHR